MFIRGDAIPKGMNANLPQPTGAPPVPSRNDRGGVLRAFNLSLAFVLLLVAVYTAQGHFDWRPWAVAPLDKAGLLGILGALIAIPVAAAVQLIIKEVIVPKQNAL